MYGLMNYYKLNVKLTEEDVSRALWDSLSKTASSASREMVTGVLHEAQRLAKPEAVCMAVPVERATRSQVFMEGGHALTSDLLARLACSAQSMLLAICTLGDKIDGRVEEYNRKGLPAHAYFLDVAGTCIIEAAGRQLVEKVKGHLERRGLKLTIPLGPGHSYWENLLDQKVIYSLLEPSGIGVSLLKSGMLLPKKTVSMVMGIGRDLPPSAGNHCHYCSMGRECPLSRAGCP